MDHLKKYISIKFTLKLEIISALEMAASSRNSNATKNKVLPKDIIEELVESNLAEFVALANKKKNQYELKQ